MRKLLLLFVFVLASIGAWSAAPVTFGDGGSWYQNNDDGSYTLHIKAVGDMKSQESTWNYGDSAPWVGAVKLYLEIEDDVSIAEMSDNSKNEIYMVASNWSGKQSLLDLSRLSKAKADELKNNWSGRWTSSTLTGVIVPNSYATDPGSFCVRDGLNNYGIDGSDVYAYITSDSSSDLSGIVAGVDGTVTGLHISGTAAGDEVISAINSLTDITNASISGKMHQGVNITIDNDNITSLDFSGIKPADGNTLKIDVSGCDNLTNINLTDATVAEVKVSENFSGSIHVSDPDSYDFTLIPSTAANYVEGPVAPPAPPYTLSNSGWELVDNNTSSVGDQIYWKVNNTATENSVVTINVSSENSLASVLETLSNDGYTGKFTKVVITGELGAADMEALGNVNSDALDLSGVTLQESLSNGKSILSTVSNSVVKEIILPAGSKRDDVKDGDGNVTKIGIVNAANLAGFTNLYSAAALEELPKDANSNQHVTYSVNAYVKKPGSLQSTMMLIDNWGYNGSKNVNATPAQIQNVMVTGNAVSQYLRDVVVSGTINAYDISAEAKLQDGHVTYEAGKQPSEPIHGAAQHGVLTGYDSYGPFNGAGFIASVDLRDAEFDQFQEYKADFTMARLGILSQTWTHRLVIPEAESVNEIPGDFFYVPNGSLNGIKEICIPSNIEYIRAYAFTGSLDHIWTTAGSASYEDEYTKYDNGAYTVNGDEETVHYGYKEGYAAYTYGTYTFSSNLKLIESHAFANSTPNVKDVYVLALEAPQCHVDAFNTVMYYGNNGYDQNLINEQGIVTRDAYKNGNAWITMLHYPKQVKAPHLQRYTDPTRQYSIATGDKDGNGATIYYPNHSEFGFAYGQGTTGYVWDGWKVTRTGSANGIDYDGSIGKQGWQVADQSAANAKYNANDYAEKHLKSFYDVTDGGNTNITPADNPVAPETIHSIYWSERDYKLTNTKVDDSYVLLYDADYRGWHQFVLNGYSANTTRIVEFERSYITDSDWWTICLPYDLTRDEMIRFYGDKDSGKIPYLSRLLYVTRDIKNEKITLNFSKNLMENKEIMANEGDIHGELVGGDDNTYGIVHVDENTQPSGTDIVLHAGVPYVIKPYIPVKTDANKDQENVSRRFAFYKDNPDDEALYEKVKAAREMEGSELIDLVENGLYNVPALIKNNVTGDKHENESEKVLTINGEQYKVSADFSYTMVGSLFNNLLPKYCYYLGWKWDNAQKTKGHACFYYKNFDDNVKWAWTNNTCIICPNWNDETKVHLATSTADPARWIVGGDANTVEADDIVKTASAPARTSDITFDSDIPEFNGITGISEIRSNRNNSAKQEVYDLNGRFLGNSVKGLAKGVYMVNGKKVVID